MNQRPTIPPDQPVSHAEAAELRHNLVMPLNVIIGYSELIIAEANGGLNAACLADVREIHQQGFAAVRSIDRVLLDQTKECSTGDLRRLGQLLTTPAGRIVALCERWPLIDQRESREVVSRNDLARIKLAGDQIAEFARCLEAGTGQYDLMERSTREG